MRKNSLLVQVCCLILATAAKSQIPGETSSRGTHGLTLTIKESSPSKDSDENTSQRSHFKSCLDRHPSFACKPLIVTLKNEGDETILRWFTTCPGGILDASFDLWSATGGWHSFRPGDSFSCTANVTAVQWIGPGESYEWRSTLADLNLQFDARVAYAFRMRWDIAGCIAAQRDSPRDDDPARVQCLGDRRPEPRFVSLQSNEIWLVSDPAQK